jgi:WD40 repeat protein
MSNATADDGPALKARVFISYSRKDMASADRLEAALKARGIEPLIDRSEIYAFEDWWKRIESLIARADTVIFVISPDAISSEICLKEIEFAASLNKRFAPIVCRRVDGIPVPEALARLNYIYFDKEEEFEAAADRLVAALQTDIHWIRRHTELGEQSRRWELSGRPAGLLLRSPVLEEAEQWAASRPQGAPPLTAETQTFIRDSRSSATRRRNMLTGSLAAGLLLALALAGLAYWQRGLALQQEQIANQERGRAEEQRQIAQKNEATAQEQRTAAVRSEAEAKRQRDDALRSQSRFLADLANQNTKVGNASAAMLLALEALPDVAAGIERPYVPQAEAALVEARRRPNSYRILETKSAKRVTGAAWSTNGERAFIAFEPGETQIWDTVADHLVATVQGNVGQFSPGGERIATLTRSFGTVGRMRVENDDVASVWDAATGNEISRLVHAGPVTSVSFSRDGKRVVTTSEDSTAQVRNGVSGNAVVLRGHTKEVVAATFSPDGLSVATASNDNTARTWDSDTGKAIAVLSGHGAPVTSVEFSPDGRRVATSSEEDSDRSVRVWDAHTGKQVSVFTGYAGRVWKCKFSTDGRRLYGLSERAVFIWDVESRQLVATLGHSDLVTAFRQSQDGRRAVTASRDRTARVWDLATGKETAVLQGHTDEVVEAAFSPDGTRVLTASKDGTARVWTEWGSQIYVLGGHQSGLVTAAFDKTGQHVLTVASNDPIAKLWRLAADGDPNVIRHNNDYGYLYASHDGSRFVLNNNDQEVSIWDAATGRLEWSFQTSMIGADFSPDNRRLVTAGRDGTARVWDVAARALLFTLDGHTAAINSAVFSPDGRLIATGSEDHTVRLWDARDGRSLRWISAHSHYVWQVEFSRNSKHLLSTSRDGTARLWDVATGDSIAIFRHPGLSSAKLDPVRERVLTEATDGTIRLWDFAGKEVDRFEAHFGDPQFSPDGRRLLGIGNLNQIHIIDLATREVIGTFEGRTPKYGADGRSIISTSYKGVRVWPIFPTTQELIDHVKDIVGQCLSRNERQRFFLAAEPPEWCIIKEKWPYQSQDWKDWLRFERANANPPLPDTPEWQPWLAAHK